MRQAVRALLIDGASVMLPTFRAGLLKLGERVLLVSVASMRTARQLLCDDPRFDFVLIDLQATGGNGFELLAEICRSHQAAPVLAYSSSLSTSDVVRAIYLGAAAFVPRTAGSEGMLEAIRSVSEGRVYLPPLLIDRAVAPAASVPAIPPFAARSRRTCSDVDSVMRPVTSLGLTRRQSDVLNLLLEGQSNKVMARQLNLSVETIKDHVTRLLRTLNVRSRTQAVLAVSGMGSAMHSTPQARAASLMT